MKTFGMPAAAVTTIVVLVLSCASVASAEAHHYAARGSDIRRELRSPSDHPLYAVELEPHFVLQWTDRPFRTDVGVGLGFRASIPLLQRGPISTLNNNLAISFGMDWAYFGACRASEPDCDGSDFWFPVVMQWNFFLAHWWSVFPELGMAVHHATWGWRCDRSGRDCRVSDHVTEPAPAFWLGSRFSLSNTFSFVLRLGYPSLLAGVSFRI
jgi:hypothetical protein